MSNSRKSLGDSSPSSLMLVYVASLTALAVVLKLRFFEIPYPPAPFLKYDISGVPLTLIVFISAKYIPPALLVYFLVHVLMGADPIGMAMKCLAEISTFIPIVLVYSRSHSKKAGIFSVICAVVSRVAVMALANYAITPYWLLWVRWAETLEDAYAKMLAYMPHVVIFNATLALVVAPLSVLVYNTLRKAGYIP